LDVRKTAGTERAERTRHGMEVWNIYLVKRLAERKGSIAGEEQAREDFCFDVTGACDIPRSSRSYKGWSVLPFPFTFKKTLNLAYYYPTHFKRAGHLTCLHSGPVLPACLAA
jgi:hypothetical protein